MAGEGVIEAEQKVKQINKEWVAALERGDTATLNQLMAEDCIFSYALDGDDKAQFISDIDSGALRVESIKRDNVEVRIYGQTGVLLAYDTTDWRYKGHAHGRLLPDNPRLLRARRPVADRSHTGQPHLGRLIKVQGRARSRLRGGAPLRSSQALWATGDQTLPSPTCASRLCPSSSRSSAASTNGPVDQRGRA